MQCGMYYDSIKINHVTVRVGLKVLHQWPNLEYIVYASSLEFGLNNHSGQ